jgi:hypothetical protein
VVVRLTAKLQLSHRTSFGGSGRDDEDEVGGAAYTYHHHIVEELN